MLPLVYLAVGFAAGYLTGARHRRADALRREASAVLDSVGKLSAGGALNAIVDLKVKSGDDKNGVQVAITTREPNGVPANDYVAPGAHTGLDA